MLLGGDVRSSDTTTGTVAHTWVLLHRYIGMGTEAAGTMVGLDIATGTVALRTVGVSFWRLDFSLEPGGMGLQHSKRTEGGEGLSRAPHRTSYRRGVTSFLEQPQFMVAATTGESF
jgi:hypothetical protein